jgi:signal peptidase I
VLSLFGTRILREVAGDMDPTIETGEFVYVNVHAYGSGVAPARGDLVVFRTRAVPAIETRNGESALFLKRVVGLPGETISIVNGMLVVNGVVPPELERLRYVTFDVPGGNLSHEGATFTVPQGTVYVLGDNSENSYDSRFWGPVPLKALHGRADGCVWPVAKMRWY